MTRRSISLLLACVLALALCVPALASSANEPKQGFYNVKVEDVNLGIVIEPQLASGQAATKETYTINDKDEDLYTNAVRLKVTYTASESNAGKYYLVLGLQSQDGKEPTDITEKTIAYIDQDSAKTENGTTTASFNVYPVGMTPGNTYFVYLSSNASDGITGKTLVASFSYFTDYMLGDVDGDKSILPADATEILMAYVQLKTLSGSAAKAADVDGDGAILPADATEVLKYYVKLPNLIGTFE